MLEIITNLKISIDTYPLFWVCASVGSTLFVIQFMLTLFGADGHEDFDNGTTSIDNNVKWLSKQALTGFLMMFGWTGITCKTEFQLENSMAILISFAAGLLTIFITGYIFKTAGKLHSPGNVFRVEDTIGKEALVYQRIPHVGMGKITVSLQEHSFEVDAISHNQEEINSFAHVQIIKKLDDTTVVVIPIHKE